MWYGFTSLRNVTFVRSIHTDDSYIFAFLVLRHYFMSEWQQQRDRAKYSLESLNMLYSALGEGWIYYMSNTILTLIAPMKFSGCSNQTKNLLGIFTWVRLNGAVVGLKRVVLSGSCVELHWHRCCGALPVWWYVWTATPRMLCGSCRSSAPTGCVSVN